jgi:hypothetical protein
MNKVDDFMPLLHVQGMEYGRKLEPESNNNFNYNITHLTSKTRCGSF